ncbi:MAG: DnaA regulatory inactivator Hda [Gammaproteobacteria bacterium]|nr:DnaA regulatory inactivator Hda [Gammaproteobacteria bacterium]
MNADQARQLTLGVRLREGHDFENFVTGRNSAAVAALHGLLDGFALPLVYLWGESGTGKTHLLEALCARGSERGMQIAYVPLAKRESLDPEMLVGLDSASLVCVDDVHAVAGDLRWEEALFHLYNQLDSGVAPMVIAALRAPLKCGWRLKDLESRLASGATYEISPLNDDERATVLRHRARARGFEFPDDAIRYILRREERSMHTLMSILDCLDTESLTHQRKVSIPLVKDVLSRLRD